MWSSAMTSMVFSSTTTLACPSTLATIPTPKTSIVKSMAGQLPRAILVTAEWVRWRAEKITQLMGRIAAAVKAADPDAIVSLSPNPPDFAYQQYLQDWRRWVSIRVPRRGDRAGLPRGSRCSRSRTLSRKSPSRSVASSRSRSGSIRGQPGVPSQPIASSWKQLLCDRLATTVFRSSVGKRPCGRSRVAQPIACMTSSSSYSLSIMPQRQALGALLKLCSAIFGRSHFHIDCFLLVALDRSSPCGVEIGVEIGEISSGGFLFTEPKE